VPEEAIMSRTKMAAAFMLSAAVAVGAPMPSSAADSESKVVTAAAARKDTGDWGAITVYFEGETRSVSDNFAATITLKPGAEIHPPHEHAEEEYLLITEGAGTWVLGDQSFSARAGDMLYAAPWVNHGLRNGTDGPMKFVVWKFTAKGLPAPGPAPRGEK
jgi:mannose-6-phosphate isomerase-like protein (cupin superfamily)